MTCRPATATALGRLLHAAPGTPDEAAGRLERSDLFEAVHNALAELARSGPLLLLVEDLHWADRSTREMLSFLFTRSFSEPVFVVASYRSDDLHRRHPLRSAVGEWARLPGLHRLGVPPLPAPQVRSLVRELHDGPLPERTVLDIIGRSEGNAFFVEELVAAAERGDASLPDDLAGLLLVRLDNLGDDASRVVRAERPRRRRPAAAPPRPGVPEPR